MGRRVRNVVDANATISDAPAIRLVALNPIGNPYRSQDRFITIQSPRVEPNDHLGITQMGYGARN